MKYISILIFLSIIATGLAQKNSELLEGARINYPFGVGPFIFAKAGVNAADVREGIKNGVAMSPLPDFGVTGYIPFNEESKIGATIDIAYSTYAYQKKLHGDEGNPWIDKFHYFTISPSIHVWGFLLGLGLGIPLGGEYDKQNLELKSDYMSFMVELRIGAMIPIVESDFGRLNILIMGGYFLTGQFTEQFAKSGYIGGEGFNTHPASLGLGINYIFNIPD